MFMCFLEQVFPLQNYTFSTFCPAFLKFEMETSRVLEPPAMLWNCLNYGVRPQMIH